ncbi:MAG TPA: FHA domain-containing protein [Gammaproteobacteria bacterium]
MPRFGSFELDTLRRQLFFDGRPVHLTPKAFDLLSILVDAAPRVVSKAELHERLWPRVAVTDATLSGLVKEVRRAIAAHDPLLDPIRTAHRFGYAMDVPVTRATPAVSRWLVVGDRRMPLLPGENLIGRDPAAAVWLDSPLVSRRHARIVVHDTAVLEDLGSKNGTSVRGAPVKSAVVLRNGDCIVFGGLLGAYREAGPPPATVTRRSVAALLGERTR